MVATTSYTAFGESISSSLRGGAEAISFGFSTKPFSPTTGLSYFGARYYRPDLSRWLTKDPYPGELVTPSSLHSYLYAYNNPPNLIDPVGETPIAVTVVAIGGAVGGITNAVLISRSGGDVGDVVLGFGTGFLSGSLGTASGLLFQNPFVSGATASFVANISSRILEGAGFSSITLEDFKGIARDTLTGGFLGGVFSKAPILRQVGRRPDIFRSRSLARYGPNSLRALGQEGAADVTGAFTGIIGQSKSAKK